MSKKQIILCIFNSIIIASSAYIIETKIDFYPLLIFFYSSLSLSTTECVYKRSREKKTINQNIKDASLERNSSYIQKGKN